MFCLLPKSSKKHLLKCYRHKLSTAFGSKGKLRWNQKFTKACFTTTSNRVTKDDKVANTLKSEADKSDVFLKRETKLKAGILEGQISIDWQSTTRTNSQLFRYDYWKWIVEFTDKISHRNELKEAQAKAEQIKHELESIRCSKKNLENEINEVRCKLTKISMERNNAMTHYRSSSEHQLLLAQNDILKGLEVNLAASLKALNEKEEDNFQQFLLAIEDSYNKENSHNRFLKASILFGIVFTLILTSMTFYIHNFNLMSDVKKQADTIRELQTQIFGKKTSVNQQSWTAYLTSWVYRKK